MSTVTVKTEVLGNTTASTTEDVYVSSPGRSTVQPSTPKAHLESAPDQPSPKSTGNLTDRMGGSHPLASRINTANAGDSLMTAIEVAAVIRTSERYVRDHTTRRSPKIRGVKMGKLMRYRRSDVDEFIVRLSTDSASRARRSRD